MMKKALAIATSLLFASSSVSAYECYDLPHGENGKGSKKSAKLPPITSAFGSNSKLDIAIRNQGTRNYNIKIRLYDQDGNVFLPSLVTRKANFSSSNDPITDISGSGAAFLTPDDIGVVRIENTVVDTFTTEITWQTDACLSFELLESPIIVNAQHHYNLGSQSHSAPVYINAGQSF